MNDIALLNGDLQRIAAEGGVDLFGQCILACDGSHRAGAS